ncbi:PREDICTED: uncharacterized protein LOC104483346, partial [Chlamydotis macqueenii]|uniref:uncharacterized protein LOC104483346 n=1 Tax=Chlamydotis macqueenii TaxID=187382 RepID=UPI00052A0512
DVHIVSTLEPLSNAVKRNVPRCTITPVLLEQAHFRISVTCPSFVQTILIRLLKDQRKKQIVQCATALETSWINFFVLPVASTTMGCILGKTARCWCVIHATKATILSVYNQLWTLYQQMVGNVKTVEYVLSVAHEQVVSGTIIVWWIHIECDRSPGNELESQLKDYVCTLCKQGEGDQTQSCDVMDTSELIPEPEGVT